MIFNVGAGGTTDADKIKYGDSNVGATLDNLTESVDELDKSVGELNESLQNIETSYYDDVTKTLYIQGGTSNYTYDSATQTLYIG